jgi:selenocysteine-specific elongation factor
VTQRLILGTAGHIDHGKTALVRALTGVDTDRLPEEKRRGITIDLGFAQLPLPGGIELGMVDVPGHEGFVRNMLAGATGFDLMLLVVAADEGVMPQTREHLAIIDLLGIHNGVVAVTKRDLVEDDWLDLVVAEVHELLAPTPLAGAAIVPVSAVTGQGLPALQVALAACAAAGRARDAGDVFRLPIDRVFTVRGTGTVVTGTAWSGTLRRDAQLRIEPAGLVARVRALQRHGAACDEIHAGERAAVALTGVDRQAIARGDCLLLPGWAPSDVVTAELKVLGDAAAPLTHRQRIRVHLGTGEVVARVALYRGALEPGGSAVAQLRLEQPLLCRAGDRFVIRSWSPVRTIAGGIILEPRPPRRKRIGAAQEERLRALRLGDEGFAALLELAGSAGVSRAELPVLLGVTPARAERLGADTAAATIGDRFVAAGLLATARTAVLDAVGSFHDRAPLEEGAIREALRRLAGPAAEGPLFDAALQALLREGRLVAAGNAVAAAGFQPAADGAYTALLQRLVDLLDGAGLEPPDLGELPPDLAGRQDLPVLLRFLERQGTVVRLTPTRCASAAAVSAAISALRQQVVTGQPVELSDFKQVLGLTRKHLIPFLEYLDREGVTVRAGETRVLTAEAAGPPP